MSRAPLLLAMNGRGHTVIHVHNESSASGQGKTGRYNESSASGQAPEEEGPGRRVQRSQLRLAPISKPLNVKINVKFVKFIFNQFSGSLADPKLHRASPKRKSRLTKARKYRKYSYIATTIIIWYLYIDLIL